MPSPTPAPSPIGPTSIPTLSTYLTTTKPSLPIQTITLLTGGTANFVFRITTTTSSSSSSPPPSSLILKHAEPYIASSTNRIPFPVSRMDFEVTALRTLPSLFPTSGGSVALPEVLSYDEEAKVLLMSDGGDRTLKAAYMDLEVDIAALGHRLGVWLAQLHNSTKTTNIGPGGNPVGKAMYRWAYSHLHQVAEKYNLDTEFCKQIDAKYGALLAVDDECVCHGDFWPGNVLVSAVEGKEKEKSMVVDWEMCRRGCGATDVGQFGAEAWLLDRCRGARGLKGAFLAGYREEMEKVGVDLGEREREWWVKRVAVHMGVHMGYWPASVKWADEAGTREIIEMGHEIMRKGDEGDMEWLAENVLDGLF